jgi:hypothetical protein
MLEIWTIDDSVAEGRFSIILCDDMYDKMRCREKVCTPFDSNESLTYKLAVLQVLTLQIDLIRICRGSSVMRLEFDAKGQITTDREQCTTHFGTRANAKNCESHGSQSLKKALIDLESGRIVWRDGY